jgi:Leucine-rich repeat (LRR) protein
MTAWRRGTGKWARVVATVAVVAASAGVASPSLADDDVAFADPELAQCVAGALGLPSETPITAAALASLTELTCDDTIVNSFVGIEGATALTSLRLDGGFSLNDAANRELAAQEFFLPITALENLTRLDFAEAFPYDRVDPTPLATIPSLRELTIRIPNNFGLAWVTGASNLESLTVTAGGSIHDLTPLATLTGLTSLSVEYAQGSLTAIAALTDLRTLHLPSAEATDWDSLTGLTNLRDVYLTYSNVTSLEWLADAHELTSVAASATEISDLSPLLGADGLERLYFSSTNVTDFAPVTTFPALKELGATCPDDADPSPVAEVTTLEVLYLTYCDIDDATMFAGMTELRELWVGNNKLSDLRPLAGLSKLSTLWALGQRIELPPVDACVPYALPLPYNVDGSMPTFSGPSSSWGAFENGMMTWAVSGTTKSYTFGTYDNRFSGTFVATINPGPAYPNCAFSTAPAVTISGQAQVGATLTASFDGTWSPSPAGWTESLWMRDGISGVDNGLSYVVQPSDAGHTITFRLKGNRPGFEVKESLSNAIYIPLTFDSSWVPAMATVPSVGHTATIAPPPGFPVAASMTCTWTLNNVAVSQGTGCDFTPTSTAGGKQLAASVQLTAPGYTDATFSVAPKVVLKALGALNTIGRINKDAASNVVDAGAKLTATLPTYRSTAPSKITVQWTRNGVNIPGATGMSYTTTSADAGAKVGATFLASRDGYRSEPSNAIDVFSVRKVFTTKPTPTISGTKAVGFTMTVSKGTWSATPTSYSYRWYRDGKAITGATGSSYKATTADGGHKITVRVWAKRSGYTTTYRTSASATILKRFTAAPTPTISGTSKVTYTLKANAGTWGPGTVTKYYQWYRNGKAISGATNSSYKVSVKDAYASITVKVTGKKSGYLTVSRTSTAKKPVGIKYANCTDLRKHYPGGVAKSSSTIDKIGGVAAGGILSTTYVSASLYTLNSARDRDKDGWACEPD